MRGSCIHHNMGLLAFQAYINTGVESPNYHEYRDTFGTPHDYLIPVLLNTLSVFFFFTDTVEGLLPAIGMVGPWSCHYLMRLIIFIKYCNWRWILALPGANMQTCLSTCDHVYMLNISEWLCGHMKYWGEIYTSLAFQVSQIILQSSNTASCSSFFANQSIKGPWLSLSTLLFLNLCPTSAYDE